MPSAGIATHSRQPISGFGFRGGPGTLAHLWAKYREKIVTGAHEL
jgi:hypothetical protein